MFRFSATFSAWIVQTYVINYELKQADDIKQKQPNFI